MKKVSIVLIFVLLAVFSLSAVSNGQKIYPVDSKEYEDIRYLYLITGHAFLQQPVPGPRMSFSEWQKRLIRP